MVEAATRGHDLARYLDNLVFICRYQVDGPLATLRNDCDFWRADPQMLFDRQPTLGDALDFIPAVKLYEVALGEERSVPIESTLLGNSFSAHRRLGRGSLMEGWIGRYSWLEPRERAALEAWQRGDASASERLQRLWNSSILLDVTSEVWFGVAPMGWERRWCPVFLKRSRIDITGSTPSGDCHLRTYDDGIVGQARRGVVLFQCERTPWLEHNVDSVGIDRAFLGVKSLHENDLPSVADCGRPNGCFISELSMNSVREYLSDDVIMDFLEEAETGYPMANNSLGFNSEWCDHSLMDYAEGLRPKFSELDHGYLIASIIEQNLLYEAREERRLDRLLSRRIAALVEEAERACAAARQDYRARRDALLRSLVAPDCQEK